jgi:TPR repeat protein
MNQMENLMTHLTLSAAARRTSKVAALLMLAAVTLSLTGCGCGLLSKDAWSGGGRCAKLAQERWDAEQQQTQRELPALKKRADDGDVKAQVAIGEFHLSPQHPNAVRATGLAYYEKAARQGSSPAQYTFVTETYKDCQNKARKLGQKDADGPQFAPHCAAEWQAFEALATKSCARGGRNLDTSIQVALGKAFDEAGKADDADFWFVVAVTHCAMPAEHSPVRGTSILIGARSEGGSQQVRGAMWLGVRGRHNFYNIPLGTPEVEAKAKARLAMLQARVDRSGIRPAQVAVAS